MSTRERDRNAAPRRGLTEAKPRDRVGGGMQRSGSDDATAWEPSSSCSQEFHFVKFINGNFEVACECLTKWYTD